MLCASFFIVVILRPEAEESKIVILRSACLPSIRNDRQAQDDGNLHIA